MMLNKHKKICLVLPAVLLMLLMVSATALAAGDPSVDLTKKGSISLTLRDSAAGHAAVPGGTFTLYRVAKISKSGGSLQYTFTDAFADSGVSLGDLAASGLAEHLAAYAALKKIAGTSATGDAGGSVKFSGLEVGLYLLVQTTAATGYYPASPFLVSIPMAAADGSGWIYDVDASPKAQARPVTPGTTRLSVKKVWQDDGKATPSNITVRLLRDGVAMESIVLNAANKWAYSWESLDKSYVWSVVETSVPTGYTARYATSGTTVTITNTSSTYVKPTPTPSIPLGPPLIQTGQLNWPIPVLASAGIALFAWGWAMTFLKRKEEKDHA